MLQIQLNKVVSWLIELILLLNIIKAEFIKFGRRLKKAKPLEIDGTMIPMMIWLRIIKFLGIDFNTRLKFNIHTIQYSSEKTQQIRAALYPILNSHIQIPIKTNISIY